MKAPPSEVGRKWPQYLAAIIVTLAAFTTCIHTGWPTPFLPKLLSDDYPFNITNDEASYITIISPIGNVIGGFIATTFIDIVGRKTVITSVAIPQILSFFMISLSFYAKELLYVARIIGGIAEGATFSVIPLYIGEIAEKDIRGTLGTIMAMSSILGMLFVNILGSYVSIPVSALIFLLFPIAFVVGFWKMPESPYYLLMKGRKSEAEEVLKFLRRKPNVGKELLTLTNDVNRQMSESGSFKDIFVIESNRKAFLIVTFARIIQQFTGCTAFMQYAQLLVKQATEAMEPLLASSILLLVQLAMGFLSSFFIDRFGRKPLLIFSASTVFLDLLIQGVYFHLKDFTSVDMSVIDWFPLLMMVLFVVLFSLGLMTTVQILISEIFSASVKSKAACMVNAVFALSMMATTKFYQTTSDTYGLVVPYYSFAFCTLLGTLFFIFFLPETKGKSLEEIQQSLKGEAKS